MSHDDPSSLDLFGTLDLFGKTALSSSLGLGVTAFSDSPADDPDDDDASPQSRAPAVPASADAPPSRRAPKGENFPLPGMRDLAIGKLGSAEAGEADQCGLLVDRRRALLVGDRGGEADRPDVVACALPPGPGEAAQAGETKILALRWCPAQELSIRRGGHGRRGRTRGRVVIVRIVGRTVGKGGHAKAET